MINIKIRSLINNLFLSELKILLTKSIFKLSSLLSFFSKSTKKSTIAIESKELFWPINSKLSELVILNLLCDLLNSIIENSSDDYDIEIIVIDDGSTDNTKKIVLEFGNLIKYIFINKSGVAKDRNIGIKNATGSLLFFFDGDVTLKNDTLKKFVKYKLFYF